jgi:hypothetical protein
MDSALPLVLATPYGGGAVTLCRTALSVKRLPRPAPAFSAAAGRLGRQLCGAAGTTAAPVRFSCPGPVQMRSAISISPSTANRTMMA